MQHIVGLWAVGNIKISQDQGPITHEMSAGTYLVPVWLCPSSGLKTIYNIPPMTGPESLKSQKKPRVLLTIDVPDPTSEVHITSEQEVVRYPSKAIPSTTKAIFCVGCLSFLYRVL